MTESSVEVLAVDGDHKLGGADWDARLFDYLKAQTIEQSGDDSIEDDEASLQELRRLAEDTKKALTKAETKKVNHRLAGGMATTITVTRDQFDEMTSDLLEATITITNRMLDDAEQRFPGVRGQISAFLLVGGSSKMPAVARRVSEVFPWEPKMADPDLAVAKGAALYAAGQTVKLVEEAVAASPGGGSGPRRSLPGAAASEEAIAAVVASTGLETEQVEKLAGKTIINVLPKAVGIKLADTTDPNWYDLPDEKKFFIEHLVCAQTQLPHQADKFTAGTSVVNQDSIEIEIWEQAGAVPDTVLSANHRVDNAGLIEGLGTFRLPADSPIDITFDVDAEGTVNLLAVEPTSGKRLSMSVKIAIMSDEQVGKEKAIVSALRKGM
jgi:molecular chaperone DnaK (HSP70)